MREYALIKEAKTWCVMDKVILTDPPDRALQDSVFPVCHENVFFVENFDIPENSIVLDLCTGSGIIALFAAEKAKKVIAIDINPRAIEYAKLNSGLNGLTDKIDFIIGNLFTPVKDMKFDVITVNPPFEPTPGGFQNFLHSDGGEDGTKIWQEIIRQAPEYLTPTGSLQMIFYVRQEEYDNLCILDHTFINVHIKDLGVITPEKFDSYLRSRLSLLNPDRNLTFSSEYPIRYIYIKADGIRNEH